MHKIRYPQVAGAFYPAKKASIEKLMQTYFRESQINSALDIRCIISPHAGYIYSGAIAAKAYHLLEGQKYDTVIVISPSHYEYFDGCSVFPGNYLTALGEIETDYSFTEFLTNHSDFVKLSEQGHHQEHALEVQLPFLQYMLHSFRLVPIVMGKQTHNMALQLAELISKALTIEPFNKSRILIVSSSDLSHFYNAQQAKQLDDVVLNDLSILDDIQLNKDIESKKAEACGFGPILSGIKISKKTGARNCQITGYANSGDINRDYSSVVGYVSAVIY